MSLRMLSIVLAFSLSACSGGGIAQSVPAHSPFVTIGADGSVTMAADGKSMIVPQFIADQPVSTPWGVVTTHTNGNSEISLPDGHIANITVERDGRTSLSMPWYSPRPVVMQRMTSSGLKPWYQTTISASHDRSVKRIPVCTAAANTVGAAQQALAIAIAFAILTLGANAVADVASWGAALVLTGFNAIAIGAVIAAQNNLQAAQDTAVAAGC